MPFTEGNGGYLRSEISLTAFLSELFGKKVETKLTFLNIALCASRELLRSQLCQGRSEIVPVGRSETVPLNAAV